MTSASTAAAPGVPQPIVKTEALSRVERFYDWGERGIVSLAAILYSLHFLHPRADFPNHSPWMDWAKYTDEGWYGDGAIRHYLWGHWNLKGDFNPAAALPVWPLLEGMIFRITGVSLVVARVLAVAIFGLILAVSYALVRRWAAGQNHPRRSVAPGIAILLLAANPFCFAFTRMAILEPLLILLGLAALLIVDNGRGAQGLQKTAYSAALGLVLLLMVLTKTTGLFLLPGILYAMWAATDRCWRVFARSAGIAIAVIAVLWIAYYGLFIRPRYLADYQYLFSVNTYTRITRGSFWPVLQETLLDATEIGDTLLWSSLLAACAWVVLAMRSRVRATSLPVALVLWVTGYAAFLAYHANFAPRYYLVLAVPLILLLAMAFDVLLAAALGTAPVGASSAWVWCLRISAVGLTATLLFLFARGAQQTLSYATHPEYTFVTAVHRLRDSIQRDSVNDPKHPRLVLSISGSDISLITGLPSICDDFGVMELPERVAAYKPGWFAAWNAVEDDKMAALAPMYRLVRVGAWPTYDDPERNLLILYRLDPLNEPRRGTAIRRRYLINPHQRRLKKQLSSRLSR